MRNQVTQYYINEINIIFGFNKKTYTFIMDETEVTTVLMILNRNCRDRAYRVGSCSWVDIRDDWFAMFHATEKEYGNIMRELMKIGSVNIELRPGGKVDIVFRRGR